MQSRSIRLRRRAVAALVAAGIVVGLTLDTRTTPHQPQAASGKPPVPRASPAPSAPADRDRVPQLAARAASPRCSGSASSTRAGGPRRAQAERDRPVLPRHRAHLGRLSVRRADRARDRRRSSAATRSSRAAPTTCSTPSSSSRPPAPRYPVFIPTHAEPAAPAGLAAPGAGPPDLGRAALRAAPRGSTRATSRRWSRSGRPLRRGQPDAGVLAPRPALAAVPEEPDRPLLPRLLLAWTAQGHAGDHAVREDRRSSARTPRSARRPKKFLAGHRTRSGKAWPADASVRPAPLLDSHRVAVEARRGSDWSG